MQLSKYHNDLIFSLRMALKSHRTSEIVYKSEWLGYLPYGQYHWLEVDHEEIKLANPDSLCDDLAVLEKANILKRVSEVTTEEDIHIFYELTNE